VGGLGAAEKGERRRRCAWVGRGLEAGWEVLDMVGGNNVELHLEPER
jgi:hypothetical protein